MFGEAPIAHGRLTETGLTERHLFILEPPQCLTVRLSVQVMDGLGVQRVSVALLSSPGGQVTAGLPQTRLGPGGAQLPPAPVLDVRQGLAVVVRLVAAVFLGGGAGVAGPDRRLVAALGAAAAGGAGAVDADEESGCGGGLGGSGAVGWFGFGAAAQRGSLAGARAALPAGFGALVGAAL